MLGWRLLLAAFSIRLRVHGEPSHGALLAANHISWLDIPVLAALTPAGFVAKGEVGTWPVIGALARRYGCLLIDRNDPLGSAGQARALAARLAQGESVILFPEGTTGDGSGVLPFRSSLFAAAGLARGGLVQPVAIAYRASDGRPLTPAERRRIAWLADDALLPHAVALAALGGVTVDVWFDAPFPATDRKRAASQCREAIARRLGGPQADVDQAAALNRAA